MTVLLIFLDWLIVVSHYFVNCQIVFTDTTSRVNVRSPAPYYLKKFKNIKIVSANGQKIVRRAMRVMRSWERVASVERLFEVDE